MGLVLLGAGIMFFGVLLGFSLSERSKVKTEEIAKWEQDIDEINKN